MKRQILIFAITFASAPLSALANDANSFPFQDVEAICRRMTSHNYIGDGKYSGEGSQAAINSCIDFVQPYYNSWKQSWNVASPSDRAECLSEANGKSRWL